MKTVGVVAEYNPFHNGHAYHLAESRKKAGNDAAVVSVMSGDFVQRGEAAVYSKYARAEAACRCGADLVVELPLPWSVASAEGFAKAALQILAAAGADALSFGCETEDLDVLVRVAELIGQEGFIEEVRRNLKENPEQSFAAARQQTAERILGMKLDCLRLPNSILALEYLKAIRQGKLLMEPLAVRRRGAGHDESGGGEFASARELRGLLAAGESIRASVPPAAEAVYALERENGREVTDQKQSDMLMLSRLRFLKREDYQALPDAADGLGDRLYDALRREPDCASARMAAASRRYPLARIQRVSLYAALGITEADMKQAPPYIRVLAFNEKGRSLLRERKERAGLPILIKPAQVRTLGPAAERCFSLGADAHDFYALHYANAQDRACGEDWRRGPVVCRQVQNRE